MVPAMETATFQKIDQQLTADRVYAAIRDAILSGRLKTGQKLTEMALSKEFGVSRASIREALQRLCHEGMLQLNSYRGIRVVELSPEQLDEMLSVRLLLETEAVRLAIRRITEEDKQALTSLARKFQASPPNPKVIISLDLELHKKIWQIAGNKTLEKHLNLLVTPLFAMGTIMRYSEMHKQKATAPPADQYADHGALVAAICAGEEEEAVRLLGLHVAQNWKPTRSRIEEFLQESG